MAYTQSDLARALRSPRPDVVAAAYDMAFVAELARDDPRYSGLVARLGRGPADLAVRTAGFGALEPGYLRSAPIPPDTARTADARSAIYGVVAGMTTGLGTDRIGVLADQIYRGLPPDMQAKVVGTGSLSAEVSLAVAAEVQRTVATENLRNPPVQPGHLPGAATGFYDEAGRTPLDRLIAGNRIAGFYSGSTTYSGLAGTTFDPSRGLSSLTPQNFTSSEFARAGLDYSTTMLLGSQGFGPQAILLAANLTRDLGIDVRGNVGAVARLTRDVRGIATSLRTYRELTDEVNSEEEKARQARRDGDHAAAVEHERRAEEARRKREELRASERDRIAREHPGRPGLVQDWDQTTGAIAGQGRQIDADLAAGRITQAQADERRRPLEASMLAANTAKIAGDAAAERADPSGARPRHETAVAAVRTEVVQPGGREAALGDAADLLLAAAAPPAAPAQAPVQAAQAPTAPGQAEGERGVAEATPPGDPRRRVVAPPSRPA